MSVKIRKGKVRKIAQFIIDWADRHPILEERLAGYEKGRAIWVTREKLRNPHRVAEDPILKYAAELENLVIGFDIFYEDAIDLLNGRFPITKIKYTDYYAPNLIKDFGFKEHHTPLSMDSYWVRHFQEMDAYYEKEYGVKSTFRLEGEQYQRYY